MAAIMDILISFVIGGMLLIIILTANDIAAENQTISNGDMLVQEMLVSTAQVFEGELRNMGFGVAESAATITAADTSSISFLTDLGRNGPPVDVIRYYTGPTSELNHTQNPTDRLLHRTVNAGAVAAIGAVTMFRLSYLTQDGELLPTPVPGNRLAEIHTVEVTMEVQNPFAPLSKGDNPHALFSSSLWQQTRLASMNSRR